MSVGRQNYGMAGCDWSTASAHSALIGAFHCLVLSPLCTVTNEWNWGLPRQIIQWKDPDNNWIEQLISAINCIPNWGPEMAFVT